MLGNEAMTASLSSNPVFSILTMAFLQDTGWYQVEFDQAEPLFFGKN